jgi:hypothetical protein
VSDRWKDRALYVTGLLKDGRVTDDIYVDVKPRRTIKRAFNIARKAGERWDAAREAAEKKNRPKDDPWGGLR